MQPSLAGAILRSSFIYFLAFFTSGFGIYGIVEQPAGLSAYRSCGPFPSRTAVCASDRTCHARARSYSRHTRGRSPRGHTRQAPSSTRHAGPESTAVWLGMLVFRNLTHRYMVTSVFAGGLLQEHGPICRCFAVPLARIRQKIINAIQVSGQMKKPTTRKQSRKLTTDSTQYPIIIRMAAAVVSWRDQSL
jgi:hypothetical protein